MEGHGVRQNYAALMGLRAILAYLVVLRHISPLLPLGEFDRLIKSGFRAVDVFFILSGFILAHTYSETFRTNVSWQSYLAFLQNRLARIYPVHLITLFIAIALFLISVFVFHKIQRDIGTIYPGPLLANILLIHAWFPSIGAPNAPSWSISAEWFAYLLCPILLVGLRRVPILVKIAIAICAIGVPETFSGSFWITDTIAGDGTAGIGAISRISRAFLVGAVVYQLGHPRSDRILKSGILTAIVAILAVSNFSSSRVGRHRCI